MSGRYGYHWTPCDGGGGGWLAGLVVALVIIAAVARPVAHAAGDVLRFAVEALEVAGIVLASAVVLAAAAVVSVRVAQRRSEARRRALPPPGPSYRVTVVSPSAERSAPAIAPHRVHPLIDGTGFVIGEVPAPRDGERG